MLSTRFTHIFNNTYTQPTSTKAIIITITKCLRLKSILSEKLSSGNRDEIQVYTVHARRPTSNETNLALKEFASTVADD